MFKKLTFFAALLFSANVFAQAGTTDGSNIRVGTMPHDRLQAAPWTAVQAFNAGLTGNATPAQSLVLIGNGTSALVSNYLAATSSSTTTFGATLSVSMISQTSGGTLGNAALYTGAEAKPGTGNLWSYNPLLTIDSGAGVNTTGHNFQTIELDLNNNDVDSNGTTFVNGFDISNAGLHLANTALGIFGNTQSGGPAWLYGITCGGANSIVGSCLEIQGNSAWGLDLGNYTGAESIRLKNNKPIYSINAAGSAELPLISLDTTNTVQLGAGTTPVDGKVLATGSTTPVPLTNRFAQMVNVIDYGAAPDSIGFSDGTITSGSANFSSTSAVFTSADVGKVLVQDFGPGTAPLQVTISTVTDSHHVALSGTAPTSAPFSYVTNLFPVAYVSGGGPVVPGTPLTLVGGTGTAAIITPRLTHVVAVAQNANGSGGTNGACVLSGTTGVTIGDATSNAGLFRVNATITAGAINAIGSIVSGGEYTTNPTSLAAEPVTGCGLTGATVAIIPWALTSTITSAGVYSVAPTTVSVSGGSGQTYNVLTEPTQFYYGTDNTAAFNRAQTAAVAGMTAYKPVTIRVPGGAYLLGTGSIATTTYPISWIGDGHLKSNIQMAPGYVGDVFSWSQTWLGNGVVPDNGQTIIAGSQRFGAGVQGISVIGDRGASSLQHAMTLYDTNDEVYVNDFQATYVKGSCIRIGILKNQSFAYSRESIFTNIRCYNDGAAGAPVIDGQSQGYAGGDFTNEIIFDNVNIYAPYGPGVSMTGARGVRFNKLRLEGLEYNPANIQGDLYQIGGGSLPIPQSGFVCTDCEFIDPYEGYAAISIDNNASSITYQPYGIKFSIIAGGALGFGKGLNIKSGRQISLFAAAGILFADTNVTLGAFSSANLDLNGVEAQTTYNLSNTASLYLPPRALGNPNGSPVLQLDGRTIYSNPVNASNQGVGIGVFNVPPTGTGNTAVGGFAMPGVAGHAVTGTSNTASGYGACGSLRDNSFSNTCNGAGAGNSMTVANSNVLNGANTGATITTGVGNLLDGTGIQTPTPTTNNYGSWGNTVKGNLFALHHFYGGNAPAVACNAGSVTIDANATDSSGILTVSGASSCTVTFVNNYGSFAPAHCMSHAQSPTADFAYDYTNFVLTVRSASSALSGKIDYGCDGG